MLNRKEWIVSILTLILAFASINVVSAAKTQTITFGALPNQNLSSFPLTISATASSGLAVAFASTPISICTVTGSTVTLLATGTCTITATQPGNPTYSAAPAVQQSFTIVAFCAPPSNVPGGVTVTCVCDNFVRGTLNPSTIFNTNWTVSTSDQTGVLPSIANSGRLRLTNNTGNNAKAATIPAIFPASGNYISVEFQHYAYYSTSNPGADGMAVTLSDQSIIAVPGAFGGSLGYAQKTGTACNTLPATPCNGFAGGWIGVGLDEYGGYQAAAEGRIGGLGSNLAESVGLRGSGSGVNGYNYLAGTSTLNPTIDDRTSTTAQYGYYYQVIVDARVPTSASVTVNRNTGSGYNNLISIPNVFTQATANGFTQAAVPANWLISFTGSTGDNTNIHEIGGLRVCSQTVAPLTGGIPGSFNAIDSAYGTPATSPVPVQEYLQGHIFMKVAGTSFPLNVAALNNSQILTTYADSSAKTVTVRLINNVGLNCTTSCTSTCTSPSTSPTIADTTATQTLTFAAGATNQGQQQSGSFMLNKAWQNLVAIISDGTTTACSTDSFSVRPAVFTVSATTSGGTPLATSSLATDTPTVHAGVPFTINANSGTASYTGTPTFNFANASDYVSGATPLSLLSGSFASTTNGIATGTSFTYNDVGYFVFGNDTLVDSTWSAVDSGSQQGDCIAGSTSYKSPVAGKYGCNVGSVAYQGGRFVPDHFVLSSSPIVNRSDLPGSSDLFTYLGEPMQISFTLTALNAGTPPAPTVNYKGNFQRLDGTTVAAAPYSPITFNNLAIWGVGSGYPVGTGTCSAQLAHTLTGSSYDTTFFNCVGGAVKPITPIACVSGGVNCVLGPRISIPASKLSIGVFAGGKGTVTANLTVSRADTADGPYATFSIGAAPSDEDGVSLQGAALNLDTDNAGPQRQLIGSTKLYYGRLKLNNAYGSELMPLWMPVTAQYVTGFNNLNADPGTSSPLFGINTLDNATSFAPLSNLAMGNYLSNSAPPVSAANLSVSNNVASNLFSSQLKSATSPTLQKGQAYIEITPPSPGAPTPTGGADIALTLGATNANDNCVLPSTTKSTSGASLNYLQWSWCGGVMRDPNAHINFGTTNTRFIYLRENY